MGDGSKVRCYKEQYCIGTWNVRPTNQGKLDIVKQETARVNIDILGISELKWTGMGEFSSDDHYIYYCGQESLRRNGVALIVNKSRNAVLECNFKNDRMICLFPRQTIQYHINPSLCPNQVAEEAELECFYENLQDLLELTNTPKRCPFHYRGLKCKSRKSRDTWSNRQIWPWSTKQSRSKVNRVCQENVLVTGNTLFQQHERRQIGRAHV